MRRLRPADGHTGNYFGETLAISGDRIIAGASGDNAGGTDFGAVYVFERNAGGADNWGQTAKLIPPKRDNVGSFIDPVAGRAVDLIGDVIAIGSQSASFVYRYNGSTWILEGDTLRATPSVGTQVTSIKLNETGDTFVASDYQPMGFPKGVKRDFNELEKRRLKAAELFEKGETQAEVRRKLKASAQSVSRWYAAWQNGGKQALKKAGRAGRKPLLAPMQLMELEAALQRGPEVLGYVTQLWTLRRVAELIHKRYGVKYHPGHVTRILQSLGWSCQKPARQALEKDEQKVRHWKRYRWPHIKKKPAQKGAPSSSSMKAD